MSSRKKFSAEELNRAYEEARIPERVRKEMRFKTFKNVNKENTDVKDIVQNWDQSLGGLYIYGPVGVGKTHVLSALACEMVERGDSVYYANAIKLMTQLRLAIRNKKQERLQDYLGRIDHLFIDDIGVEKQTNWMNSRVYEIMVDRWEKNLPTYFTSNYSILDLSKRCDFRIASRIEEICESLQMTGNDFRKKKAKDRLGASDQSEAPMHS